MITNRRAAHQGTFPLTRWDSSLYKETVTENEKRTHNTAPADVAGGAIGPTPGWPAARVRALIRLWNTGLSAARIGTRLDATTRAVESKVRNLRVAGHALATRRPFQARQHRRASRRCLYCGRTFASSHAGNRLCPECLETGPFTGAMV